MSSHQNDRQPHLLILSFSPLADDARVLKQIRHFAGMYQVTTCGYGPSPDPRVEHIQMLPDGGVALDGRLITLHAYSMAYSQIPSVASARRLLAGRRFDGAIANDIEALPIALDVAAPSTVLADLHEYSPRLHEEHALWAKRIAPFYTWLVGKYAPRAGATSTVGQGLADEFQRVFGFSPRIVTNAAPLASLTPTEVGDRVRLVHSGACLRNRRLDLLLDGVEQTSSNVSLDLYLTANDPGFLAELRERSASMEWVTVHDPVPYSELISTLNSFDVGVHILPPVNFNNRNALPNKVFDYVQARLGLIVGPTPEMAELVRERKVGVVTSDFTADSFASALDGLTTDTVSEFKVNAHAAAPDLSAQTQIAIWDGLVSGLIEQPKEARP